MIVRPLSEIEKESYLRAMAREREYAIERWVEEEIKRMRRELSQGKIEIREIDPLCGFENKRKARYVRAKKGFLSLIDRFQVTVKEETSERPVVCEERKPVEIPKDPFGCQGRSKIPPLRPVEFSPTPDFTAGRE